MTKKSSLPRLDQSVRHPIDMSPEAILARLKRCSALSVLCIKLKNAKKRPMAESMAKQNRDGLN
ncbi:MAG: hypothetical protein ABJZ55_03725 [Fuerstiella sp.]